MYLSTQHKCERTFNLLKLAPPFRGLHVVVRLFGVTKVQEEDVEEEEAKEMCSGGLQKRRNVNIFLIDQN